MSSVNGEGSQRSRSSSSSEDPVVIKQNVGCFDRLKELSIPAAEKKYLSPVDPGTQGNKYLIQTNVFGIEVEQSTKVFQYVVHAKADLPNNKEVVFTKKGKEDFVVRERHIKSCDILLEAITITPQFFKMNEGNQLIYDGQSCLFATIDLFPGEETLKKKIKLIQVDGAHIENEDLNSLAVIQVEIHAAKKESFIISPEKLKQRTADTNLKANNRGYTQLLELILNQTCIRDTARFGCFEHGKVFCLKPWEEDYKQSDCVDVGDGKTLLPGFKKSIQFIEGPFGRGQNNPSVVIDAMKTAFHKEQSVMEKLGEILGKDPSNGISDVEREKVVPVIKGLHCRSSYTGRTRHLRIEGIHLHNAKNARFELKDGGNTTVQSYFREKYHIDLKHPNSNLLICKERGNQNFYPMELLTIDKDQRVQIVQQTSAQSQKTTKECAVLPLDRQRLIMTGKTAAGIVASNELLEVFGIKVYDMPMLIEGRSMEGKDINFGGRSIKALQGKWRPNATYCQPANWPRVWAVYAVGNSYSKFVKKDLHDFLNHYTDICQKKGIRINQPAEYELISVDKVIEKLEFASQNECKFVFLITDDSITHLHQKYKLFERNHDMIIQDMKMSKVINVLRQNKMLTLENVINKTNVKLGGLNHTVQGKSLSDDQLVIGVGLSAPVGSGKFVDGKGYLNPLVLGYASNAKATHEFAGDFLLAYNGEDSFVDIEDIMRNSIEMYEKHREKLPKKVIIYRSGASEGAHPAVIAYEIPLARSVIEDFGGSIKLIYIVVTKDHSFRFFKDEINASDRTTDQNIPPGVVLDTCVTHPSCKQFFLNSHTTLQGTAKTPLYSVLVDDCEASMDRLEDLTYTLCHHHQIVSLTTSVPTPLYVANEYAKRGRNLWTEKIAGNQIPIPDGASVKEILKDLTMELAYKFTNDLVDKRINA